MLECISEAGVIVKSASSERRLRNRQGWSSPKEWFSCYYKGHGFDKSVVSAQTRAVEFVRSKMRRHIREDADAEGVRHRA